MKELLIIKILDKLSNDLSDKQIQLLKEVLEEELYNYELTTKVTDLIPFNTMRDKIYLFLASKKLDGKSITTIKTYGECLKHLDNFIHKDIVDITTMDIRQFLAIYSQKGDKNTTLATKISKVA